MGWKDKYQGMKNRAKRAAEVVGETLLEARCTAESCVAAGAIGGARGHFEGSGKKFDLAGGKLSPELLIGGVGKVAGLALTAMNKPGKHDVNALSTGILSYRSGRVLEDAMKKRAQTPKTSGRPRLTQEQYNAARDAMRQRERDSVSAGR